MYKTKTVHSSHVSYEYNIKWELDISFALYAIF